jgi:hypothetical protein
MIVGSVVAPAATAFKMLLEVADDSVTRLRKPHAWVRNGSYPTFAHSASEVSIEDAFWGYVSLHLNSEAT